jgi:hypothetical protein
MLGKRFRSSSTSGRISSAPQAMMERPPILTTFKFKPDSKGSNAYSTSGTLLLTDR